MNRAETSDTKGDFAAALADLDQAAKLDPNSSRMFGVRALPTLQDWRFRGSCRDYYKAWSIDPREVGMPMDYVPILALHHAVAFVTSSKLLATDALTKLTLQIDQARWPYPVVKLLLGSEQLRSKQRPRQTPDQKCEANFYVANGFSCVVTRRVREKNIKWPMIAAKRRPSNSKARKPTCGVSGYSNAVTSASYSKELVGVRTKWSGESQFFGAARTIGTLPATTSVSASGL